MDLDFEKYEKYKKEPFSKKKSNKYHKSESIFEDEIFDDNFTPNKEREDINTLKQPTFYEFEEQIDDEEEYDSDQKYEDRELFVEPHKYALGEKDISKNQYSGKKNSRQTKHTESINQSDFTNTNLSSGQSIMFTISTMLLMGIGLPVLFIFYFNSPPLNQHFFILGISYSTILFLFFITSAVMIYTSMFFISKRELIIVPLFLLSIFCCFPFIAGIRNNLTILQAILDLNIFSNWPFFLKPSYVFFQFMLPTGVLVYIILQIKSMFRREKHSYTYLCIALYLVIGTVIGFAILGKTSQPNIISLAMPYIQASGMFDINNSTNEAVISPPDPTVIPEKTISQRSELAPANELAPQANNLTPQVNELTPQANELTPQANELTPQASELTPQANELAPQPEQISTPEIVSSKNVISQQPEISKETIIPEFEELRVKSNHLLSLISKIENLLEEEYRSMKHPSSKQEIVRAEEAQRYSKLTDEQNLTELKSVLNKTGNIKRRDMKIEDIELELKEVSEKLDIIWQAIDQEKALRQNKSYCK
ncbi:MAG: hypothetical protein HQK63_14730 [Desulfamplus sp.]|nr:hypothetical protein [Desulfamplus sp.]